MIGHIKFGQYQKNIARAILKKYCPPPKARGIHDFILATKSSVWIIIQSIGHLTRFVCAHWLTVAARNTLSDFVNGDHTSHILNKRPQIINHGMIHVLHRFLIKLVFINISAG